MSQPTVDDLHGERRDLAQWWRCLGAAARREGARLGGIRRAAVLTPERRRDIARHAAAVRWGKARA